MTEIEVFESGTLDRKDFYFTGDDYRYHIDTEAKRRFLEFLKDRFNSGVKYKGKTWKWDTAILGKTQELVRFLLRESGAIQFVDPAPNLMRTDISEIRRHILELSHSEAKALGIGKSTLHYLRKNAKSERSFKVYEKVAEKVEHEFAVSA